MENRDAEDGKARLPDREPGPQQDVMDVVVVRPDDADPVGDAEKCDAGHIHQGHQQR